MIKDIAVVLDTSSDRAGSFAVSLAAAHNAVVTALFLVPEDGAGSAIEARVIDDVGTPLAEEMRQHMLDPGRSLQRLAAEAGVLLDLETILDVQSRTQPKIISRVATADLIVTEQPNPARPKPTDSYLDFVLLRTGRPSLVVPFSYDKPAAFSAVTVAWDGSPSAARAVADALPLLRSAAHVEIVRFLDAENGANHHGSGRLIHHLIRHGIDGVDHEFPTDLPTSSALLNHLADARSDLLVMGAYGHSRLREALIGGVTRDVLRRMTIPVVMSHA